MATNSLDSHVMYMACHYIYLYILYSHMQIIIDSMDNFLIYIFSSLISLYYYVYIYMLSTANIHYSFHILYSNYSHCLLFTLLYMNEFHFSLRLFLKEFINFIKRLPQFYQQTKIQLQQNQMSMLYMIFHMDITLQQFILEYQYYQYMYIYIYIYHQYIYTLNYPQSPLKLLIIIITLYTP